MQPPLYPALLTVVFRLLGIYSLTSGFIILSINSLLSALTCIPIYFSAKYSLGSRGAKAAAWVWALYPFAIYFSAGRVWEYALTGLLFTTCFCIAQRIHRTSNLFVWLGWGALCGLTALSNPAVLSSVPFLLLLALYKVRRSGGRWFLNGALTTIALTAVLSPWVVRNHDALGILCPVRDNFWLEFYSGNSGDPSLNPTSSHPASNPVEMQKFHSMGEIAFLAEKHALAIEYLHQHPDFIVYKTLRRTFYYWTGFWSFSVEEVQREPYEPANVFYVSCITLLMLRGILRFWKRNRAAVLPYLVLVGIFPLTYYLTYPLMDYRQAIEPAIVVLIVAGAQPWRTLRPNRLLRWIGAERAPGPEIAAISPTK
jgi:4-amino-4-deoxy-L-arabinose transferase-like glycosyltransferase